MTERILLIGYRKGIRDILEQQRIPYALWDAKYHKPSSQLFYHLQQDLPSHSQDIREISKGFLPHGPFTHVIAGTENAVYPASVTRRVLGARKSKDSIALSCHDKLIMKDILHVQQVPMTPFIHTSTKPNIDDVINTLGFPVVVKTRHGSGGKDIHICHTIDDLKKNLHRNQLLEKFVDAPEASVESFIHNKEILFTNMTQYHQKTHVNIVPADFDTQTRGAILALNKKVICDLKLSWGMTHMEVYLTKNGPIFGEIALRPPGGYIMHLISESYGFNAWEAFVAIELGKPFLFPQHAIAASAAFVLHPGEGRVHAINGWDAVTAHPCVKQKQLNIKVNDHIEKRMGVSNEVGHIILSSQSREELMQQVNDIQNNLRIIVE